MSNPEDIGLGALFVVVVPPLVHVLVDAGSAGTDTGSWYGEADHSLCV